MTLGVLLGQSTGAGAYVPGQPGGAGGPGGPPAPNVGSGWEFYVYNAPDFHTLLAVIPNKLIAGQGFQFVKQLNDTGSASLTLNMDDPFWSNVLLPNGQPAHYLLDWEHMWQIRQDGVPRWEFLGETVTEQLIDASEQRLATITGPGMLATLKWAMVAPNGFGPPPAGVITYKTDAITDGFDEINVSGNLVVDTTLWNASSGAGLALNPAGSVQIVGSPGTTFLGSTAYDATNTLLSAQVNPMVSPTFSGATLDGSQVTQMFIQSLKNVNNYIGVGMSSTSFYAFFSDAAGGGLVTHIIASAATYAATQSNNGNYSYWQISEANGVFFIWTSPDGQNWTKQWTIAHGWDATQVGVYFSAKYDTTNPAVFATMTALNSNVVTSSLGGPTYFGKPIIGGVWLDQLHRAQARGTVPFVQTGALSASMDSFLNVWTDTNNVQLTNGTDLLSLLQGQATVVNASYIMQPGLRLQVGIPALNQITLGTDRSSQVIFRDGMDCTSRTRTRARNQISNLMAVINADGRTVTADNATSVSEYGQREAWLQAAMQVTTNDLDAVASAGVQESSAEVLSYTLQITPYLGGRTVFTGFDVGDFVGLERPDFSAVDKVQVAAIAVSVTTDGAETHELTLVSYIQWLQEQLTFIATKLGGGFVSVTGTTAIAGNGALTAQQPTVFAPTYDGLGGTNAGGAGHSPLVYDPVSGKWVAAGTVNPDTSAPTPVVVAGTNGQVVIAGDGSAVMVGAQPVTPADVGTPGPVVHTIIGLQTDGTITHADFNGVPPAVPDTPSVSGLVNGILVTWDGLLAGGSPLKDFMWTEVHVSTISGFTPSATTLQGTVTSAAGFSVSNLILGTTYYAKLVARNTSGVASTPSAQASGVPITLTASVIGALGILNQNPFFAGGDGSTWEGHFGTFTVSSSPPAGSPYTYAGFFTITTAGSGAAAIENNNGAFFKVAPNAEYLATAWVYTPTTSAVLTFWWYQQNQSTFISFGQQTFTVTANTWTLITTVQTSPPLAGWAFIGVSPADGNGNTIYFEAIEVLPQVPGGLIQAGTITATQIAAGTIFAGIVNGTLIQGATLLADGSSGELLVYSTTPALGDLIMSVSAVSSTDAQGNHFGGGVNIGAWSASTGNQLQHLGVDTSGRLYIVGPDGVTRIQINNGTSSTGPDIRFFNDFGAVLLVVDPNAGGTFQYSDTGSATQGVLIGAQSSKNTTDPIGGSSVSAGVSIIDPVFGDFVQLVGANILFGAAATFTADGKLAVGTGATSTGPVIQIDAPEQGVSGHFQERLYGTSPDGTVPGGVVFGEVATGGALTRSAGTVAEIQGALTIIGPSTPPAAPPSGATLYVDANGAFRYKTSFSGDSNVYQVGELNDVLLNQVTITTAGQTVFSDPVGAGLYTVEVWLVTQNTTSGDAATWSFSGPSAATPVLVDAQFTPAGAGQSVNYAASSTYTTGFLAVATGTGNQRVHVFATIKFTASGTLSFKGITSASTVTISPGSRMRLRPVI